MLLRSLANAKVLRDGKANRMFSKAKASGRIAPLIAATMAVGKARELATEYDPLQLMYIFMPRNKRT